MYSHYKYRLYYRMAVLFITIACLPLSLTRIYLQCSSVEYWQVAAFTRVRVIHTLPQAFLPCFGVTDNVNKTDIRQSDNALQALDSHPFKCSESRFPFKHFLWNKIVSWSPIDHKLNTRNGNHILPVIGFFFSLKS